MFKKKEDKPTIEFLCDIPDLLEIEECLPRPAKYFIPEWWKNIPAAKHPLDSTVRECPGLPDFFSQGYVIPMWADSYLRYNKESDIWNIVSSEVIGGFEVHPHAQFLDHTVAKMYGTKANIVFKTKSPWNVITSPGYSVFQMPLFYHFNGDYSILPGVVDTDIHHQMNQQVVHHSDKEEIFIKRGDPFVLYIPFKRTKYDMSVRAANEEDKKKLNKLIFEYGTSSLGQGQYRSNQRKRDKKEKK
jgi:hypothetical protein